MARAHMIAHPTPSLSVRTLAAGSKGFREAAWMCDAPIVTITGETGAIFVLNTVRLVELAARECRPQQLARAKGRPVAYGLRYLKVVERVIEVGAQATDAPSAGANADGRVDVV